ncbi:sodium/hydrogen exchanger 9B2-like [Neocloeon triangulifer]|uniref:sodium/hydrogen exchanger 9B2-like n=1 Tax=Neocloeon triangulifer TaxID=2078957 RepID=UPI00286EBCAD|nr:sodium/hydrogen exchanger 9B2-like [Neocloeon triangulifer]XP_059482695.1 sodium/hydrogen exchanger 9B2-like [Neocloeon triangulifer]
MDNPAGEDSSEICPDKMQEKPIESKDVEMDFDDGADQTKSKGWFSRLWGAIRPEVLCPQPSALLTLIMIVVMILLTFGALISLLGNTAMPPDGGIFQLVMLTFVAFAAGFLLSLCKMPPLLGMLLSGILLRNVGAFYLEDSYLEAVSSLRKLAMVVILIKAGLGLDPQALKRLSCMVIRLSFCPCLVEAVTAMFAAHLLLGMPWLWGILLGCVLAAVSPAVVVPSLLALKEEGYGEDKGISTLVIAASSLDDIAAISLFGIFLGMIFSTQSGGLTMEILQGPIEITLGIIFGICYGLLLIYIPHGKEKNIRIWRIFLLLGGGILAVFGSERVGFGGAGPLGLIVAAFFASSGWQSNVINDKITETVVEFFSTTWLIFQPILFGLIGTEIKFSELEGSTVLLGLAVLLIGLSLRVATVWLISVNGILSMKERLFVAIAWFPKATVQALLGPIALDLARQTGASAEVIHLGEQVLTISVLSILVTAPIGAIGIKFSGPRLLNCVIKEQP